MGRLDGKVAFITGAGSGIARAAAHLFAQEGAGVALVEIDRELGRRTATEIEAAGGRALFIETDVTDERAVMDAVAQTEAELGPLTTLFNCAGGSLPEDGPASEVDMSVWDHTMALDLKGTFLCCRHVIPRIVEAGGGSVINMSSIVALKGSFPMHVYASAKGAILSLTRSLAGTYARDGIRVNAISPGMVLTERARARIADSDGLAAAGIDTSHHPFAVGEPGDVANIALFLASDESRMITGATIPAEGGLTAY
jgi:NAD(P)-dependent dehydrogenase (short-subunit alcohol dehydrogenase family)